MFGVRLRHNTPMTAALRARRWALLFVLVFLLAAIGVVTWKWQHVAYGGIDLAIYTQALSETIDGRLFNLTIHPHNYFGDHLELIVFFLVPLFALVPSPLTLLVVQVLALASASIPIWHLTRRRFSWPWAPLLAVAVYLIHPLVWNAALFEFHALPFAIPLLFWALLAFESRQWWRFFALLFTTLLVREDLSLAAVGFGLLALLERRSMRWSVVPIVLGLVWLKASLTVIGYFNGEQGYKFLALYAWLGPDLRSMLLNMLTHPWLVLGRLVGITRIIGLLGMLLPFAFLPALAPRVLIAGSLFFIQLLLIGVGENTLRTHYLAPLLPFLFVASLDAINRIGHATHGRILPHLRREWQLAAVGFGTVVVAAAVVMGPLGQTLLESFNDPARPAADTKATRAFLQTIEQPAQVVASFTPLPYLAQSPAVYSAHYVFLGHRQYTTAPYPVGEDVRLLVLDDRDLLTFDLLYANDAATGPGRLKAFIEERRLVLQRHVGHVLEFGDGPALPPPTLADRSTAVGDHLRLTGASALAVENLVLNGHAFSEAAFSLRFETAATLTTNLQLRVTFADDRGHLQQEFFPLNPLTPTSTWAPQQAYAAPYRAILARAPVGALQATAEVVQLHGQAGLNGLRNIVPRYRTIETVGAPVVMNAERTR